MHLHTDHIKISRTTARVLSIILFLLWGSFFVEHRLWFETESSNVPPVKYWLVLSSHFLLLVGYIVSLKWERIGSILIIVNAVLFFSISAGVNAFPFIAVSVFPVMLYGYCWMKDKHSNARLV